MANPSRELYNQSQLLKISSMRRKPNPLNTGYKDILIFISILEQIFCNLSLIVCKKVYFEVVGKKFYWYIKEYRSIHSIYSFQHHLYYNFNFVKYCL